jgi:hypothetical protein
LRLLYRTAGGKGGDVAWVGNAPRQSNAIQRGKGVAGAICVGYRIHMHNVNLRITRK